MAPVDGRAQHVVVMVQENHTTDNYFRGMAPYGANVATDWPICPDPPPQPPFSAYYPPHDRHSYFRWLTGQITGERSQFDTQTVLPYYLYLATTGAFLENHCSGFGSNSTPNHLMLVGGQSPTLRNPPRRMAPPLWDMPSVPGLANDNALTWRCYAGNSEYPVGFYQQLKGSPNIAHPDDFSKDAAKGNLPALSYIWHESPLDEHPPADVAKGMDVVWQAVDAVVNASLWNDTVFMLTWDDWGGFDDHVATPAIEYTPDNVQVTYGPRVGLLMFGGHVRPGIDSRWCSHATVPRTAIQLLGLPDLGVPRVDRDAGLADLVLAHVTNPSPPAFGSDLVTAIPAPPARPPTPTPPPPAPGLPQPIAEIVLRGGVTLPAPNDQPLPPQPAPPRG
ncbi:MAG: hypothetical protein M3Z06_03645 [Actinomycetota bacterium]|nr:hypothetical protein [Actinomycetota bacterium]